MSDVKTYIQMGADTVDASTVTIPGTGREFRNAWRVGNTPTIEIDMVKAVEIAKDKVRQERAPVLSSLDGKWFIAMGRKAAAEADAVEAKRQKARDATTDARIIGARTPEDLKTALETVVAEMKAL